MKLWKQYMRIFKIMPLAWGHSLLRALNVSRRKNCLKRKKRYILKSKSSSQRKSMNLMKHDKRFLTSQDTFVPIRQKRKQHLFEINLEVMLQRVCQMASIALIIARMSRSMDWRHCPFKMTACLSNLRKVPFNPVFILGLLNAVSERFVQKMVWVRQKN